MSLQVQKSHSFRGHRDSIYTLAPSSDDSVFFSAGGDGMVAAWNLDTGGDGELIAQVPNSVYALHRLPKEDLLVVGQNNAGVHLIDYRAKKEIASLKLSQTSIFDIQSSADSIYVAHGDGTITAIDKKRWTIQTQIAWSNKSARTLAVHPTHGEVAIGYSDHHLRIADTHLKLLREIPAHQNSIFSVVYSPDGRWLLSAGRDARLKRWDVEAGYALENEVVAHLYAINHIAFSPDGKYFATCSLDKSVKVWDAETLTLLKVIDKGRHAGHGTSVNKLLWSPFKNRLVSASDDRTISAWDLLFL